MGRTTPRTLLWVLKDSDFVGSVGKGRRLSGCPLSRSTGDEGTVSGDAPGDLSKTGTEVGSEGVPIKTGPPII